MKPSKLSPFDHHLKLIKGIVPRLTWDGQELGPWQRTLRRTVRDRTGLALIDAQERCPLRVRRLWKRDHVLGSIEKIRFTVETGCDATAFVCMPHGVQGKLPWVVCVQGHSTGAHNSVAVDRDDNSKAIVVEGDRDFALTAMANGFAAVALEQRHFGERRSDPEEKVTCYEASMQALHIGRTTIGERVYDVDRVIDWLYSRDDVDRKRIGVMGNSGGGTTTLFSAALLKRVTFAMPSCYFCTFAQSILAMGHCCCNFVPGLQLEAEMADVMGLFAPKPLVIVAGREDPIFPIAGVRKAFRQLRRLYAAADASERLKLVIGDGGHRFYADPSWKRLKSLI